MPAPGTVAADQPVRDAIAREVGDSLVIEAGAGTGKTTVLVERIVEVLRSGRATIDQLAVITFTEKAAAELAVRVRQRLEEARQVQPAPPEDELRRLDHAVANLYRARIETIHAFAANLLRQRPVEAELDPQFEVLDDLAASLAFDRHYERWQGELLSSDRPELARALNRGFGLGHLREAAEALHAHRHVLPLVPEPAPPPELRAFAARLAEDARELAGLEARCAQAEADRGARQIPEIVAFARRVEEAADDEDELERVVLFRAPELSRNAGSRKNWPGEHDACDRMKEVVCGLVEALGEVKARLRTEALAGLIPVIQEFALSFARERRHTGRADFDDLLIWARDLLRDKVEVRRYFQSRFKAILVDEFQDTDPIQAELVMYLASDGSRDAADGSREASDGSREASGGSRDTGEGSREAGDGSQEAGDSSREAGDSAGEPGDWRALRPAPGRLVVVGDPKQSIYRFRRADIAVYDDVKDGPLAGGLREIHRNFRSVPGMLQWVNRVFDRVLVREPGVQPANTPLTAGEESPGLDCSPARLDRPPDGRDRPPAGIDRPSDRLDRPPAGIDRPPVVTVNVEPETELDADSRRKAEARALARLARRIVDVERWPVRDPTSGEVRQAEWRDIAILVPARTGADAYEDALGEAEIPFRHEGGRTFFVRQEVRELLSLLRAVDDPTDQVNLVAALRAPAFACSDEDLLLFTAPGPTARGHTAPGLTAPGGRLDYRVPDQTGPPPVLDAFAALNDLHRLRRRVSLAELVRRTLERTRMVELALTLPDGTQTAANLLKVVEQARAFSASGGGGLRAFARWLAESSETEARESDAGVAEETDDLVRMITMHSAKGLEYPIVMLANLSGEPQIRDKALPDAAGGRLHLAVGTRSRDRWFETPGFAAALEDEKRIHRAERLRLLYVAATRARDHLVVPVVGARSDAKGLLKTLLEFLPPGEGADGPGDCHVYDASLLEEDGAGRRADTAEPNGDAVASARAEREEWSRAREELVKSSSRELPYLTATSIEKPWRPLSVAAEDIDGALVAGKGPPLPVGDALHRTMELVSLPAAEDLERVARAVCAEADVLEHLEEVLAMARNCLDSPVMARALRASSMYREVPFTVPGEESGFAGEEESGFTTGRVDVVFREPDGLVVVDYKTDRVAAAEVPAGVESYRPQGDVYAHSLAAATGLPVSEVVFVFARAGVEERISPGWI